MYTLAGTVPNKLADVSKHYDVQVLIPRLIRLVTAFGHQEGFQG